MSADILSSSSFLIFENKSIPGKKGIGAHLVEPLHDLVKCSGVKSVFFDFLFAILSAFMQRPSQFPSGLGAVTKTLCGQ